ncbi:MAG: GNAT family N-acetyltransferase [Proteobacteria bacterium]|nr:GNAT family N-acetyltransferase [Pseudomonadota bacterium]
MAVKIRKATENDLERILDLANQVREFHIRIEPEIFIPMNREKFRELYKGYMSDEKFLFLVAEQGADVMGYLYAEFGGESLYTSPRGCVLTEIGVDESFQSAGTGRILFDALKTECDNRDCKKIELSVYLANTRAVDWYDKIGFRKVMAKMILKL